MTSALKLWPITVTHPRTKETISFLGQGATVAEAVSDGVKNLSENYRPNQSGSQAKPGEKGGPTRIAARRPDGSVEFKSLREFEADPQPNQQPQIEAAELDFA